MKKFKCTVTRVDTYEIELDENVLNEEWMAHFRSYMYDFDSFEDHAKHLAQFQAMAGDPFIEGYGYVNRDGECISYDSNAIPAKGVNIIIIDEDNDIDVEVEEIEIISDGQ